MTDELRIRVVRDNAEIEEIRDIWTAWQQHPNSDIDYFLLIQRARPDILRPHVVVVYRNGVADALLVGRVERVGVSLKVGYANLLNVQACRMTFIHGGFLGNKSPENGEALVSEILRSLKSNDAEMALISHFPTDSPMFEAAKRMPAYWIRDHASQTQTHRSMGVSSSVEQLYQRFSGSVRRNLKWRAKKLAGEFPDVRTGAFCQVSQLDQMFRDIEEVAKKTYQRGLGVGFEDTPEMRERMKQAAEKGWLRAYVLYIAERPCAFWVGTLYQGVLHSNFMGFDRSYAKYSPGTFLVLKVIEGFCDKTKPRCVNEIDFGLGDAEYKKILCDREWVEGSISIFAPSLAGLRLNLMLTPPAIVNRLTKEALERTGALQKVKTLWRRTLAKGGKSEV